MLCCLSCKMENREDAHFCVHCGRDLKENVVSLENEGEEVVTSDQEREELPQKGSFLSSFLKTVAVGGAVGGALLAVWLLKKQENNDVEEPPARYSPPYTPSWPVQPPPRSQLPAQSPGFSSLASSYKGGSGGVRSDIQWILDLNKRDQALIDRIQADPEFAKAYLRARGYPTDPESAKAILKRPSLVDHWHAANSSIQADRGKQNQEYKRNQQEIHNQALRDYNKDIGR